jgi:DNA-binding NtrC family response regulator
LPGRRPLTPASILIADDDPVICAALEGAVRDSGHIVTSVHTAAAAIDAAASGSFDVVLLDLCFPDCSDLSTLREIRRRSPATDVVIVTSLTDDLDIVSEAVGLGAFDYLPKPLREFDVRIALTRVLKHRELARSNERLASELARGHERSDIVGESLAVKTLRRKVAEQAAHDMPILVTGETGTGKELVSRAIHNGSRRRGSPFVTLNCCALPRDLAESLLFGHTKGAFTGAHAEREGAFEEAEEGTLLLDEIGDLGVETQAALLRVLDTGEYRPVGGNTRKSSARLVMATNRDLAALVEEGSFRKDLYYRVDRLRIQVPTLRERREDVTLLTDHFLAVLNKDVGKNISSVEPEARACLERYDWPGNVRELRNEIERAYIHCHSGEVGLLDLSAELLTADDGHGGAAPVTPKVAEEIDRLKEALRASRGGIAEAAKLLGVHRNTVRRWMRRLGVSRSDISPR